MYSLPLFLLWIFRPPLEPDGFRWKRMQDWFLLGVPRLLLFGCFSFDSVSRISKLYKSSCCINEKNNHNPSQPFGAISHPAVILYSSSVNPPSSCCQEKNVWHQTFNALSMHLLLWRCRHPTLVAVLHPLPQHTAATNPQQRKAEINRSVHSFTDEKLKEKELPPSMKMCNAKVGIQIESIWGRKLKVSVSEPGFESLWAYATHMISVANRNMTWGRCSSLRLNSEQVSVSSKEQTLRTSYVRSVLASSCDARSPVRSVFAPVFWVLRTPLSSWLGQTWCDLRRVHVASSAELSSKNVPMRHLCY